MSFSQRLLNHEFQLNDTDDDIANYIISHKEDILKLSIQKISQELYIAPNAVMRFSKKLGYSGFSELKYSLRDEIKPTNDDSTISKQLLSQLPSNIVKTLDIIDTVTIKRIAKLIAAANCTIFAGVGDSSYFCEMLSKNLRCVEYNAQYYQHIHDMFFAVRHASKGDLLVVISAKGENERLCELINEAKEIGMHIVSITHFCDNTIANISHDNLYFWGEFREVNRYNVTDRSGLMMVIRLLSEEFWHVH